MSKRRSGDGIRASTNHAAYGSAKAGLVHLAKSLAGEWSRFGIRINVVSPTLLQDSLKIYGDYFPGFIPVAGERVAQAFKKSVMGIQSGQVFRVN